MKRVVLGIMAHVDAGKTTLSEALLYEGGSIKKIGRVDSGDAFLDTYSMEKARGITIFSKQARFMVTDENGIQTEITLLDTPGHVDFSAETERTLAVLDMAVLVVSASSGVQSHTNTLWKLLEYYKIPTVIFINKTDMPTADVPGTLKAIDDKLSHNVVSFDDGFSDEMYEEIGGCDEDLMNEYLDTNVISKESIKAAIKNRHIFPALSGSALKNVGVDRLIRLIADYCGDEDCTKSDFEERESEKNEESFGAYCYKISRDEKDVRLTHIKIVSGKLPVKSMLGGEKVNSIRVYSGNKYEEIKVAERGMIVTIPGLVESKPGLAYGLTDKKYINVLEPVLSYAVGYPSDVDRTVMYRILKQLEEELPELSVSGDEDHGEIRVSLMGTIQTEIITDIISDRYSIKVTFDVGKIAYKETIESVVEGVGHFEPLRHYAEVHLKMEPLELGSGLEFATNLSEDVLDKNWQKQILTHLEERTHRGVLTGSPITDMRITLVGGKAHNKHTEGGDFRQATYRAVRQGLMQAGSVLLEPYYDFTLIIPDSYVGKAMTDIDRMNGSAVVTENYDNTSVLCGRAPVSKMHYYVNDVVAYTKGLGRLMLSPAGYDVCHNSEEVISGRGYNPDADVRNPSSSVFCVHGAGTVVAWDEVFEHMHVPLALAEHKVGETSVLPMRKPAEPINSIGTDEIDEIINKVAYSNSGKEISSHKGISAERIRQARNRVAKEMTETKYVGKPKKKKYILVDGYNVIYAWKDLKDLAADNIMAARDKLLDILCNYRGYMGEELIVVFDAYKVPYHGRDAFDYFNIHVVYTRTAETADSYIERFAVKHSEEYEITVITSDGLVQMITRGAGSVIMSSREFEEIYRNLGMNGK